MNTETEQIYNNLLQKAKAEIERYYEAKYEEFSQRLNDSATKTVNRLINNMQISSTSRANTHDAMPSIDELRDFADAKIHTLSLAEAINYDAEQRGIDILKPEVWEALCSRYKRAD